MPKFRKKPVEVEAWKWDETLTLFNEIGCKMMSSSGYTHEPDMMTGLRIETIKGTMSVNKGDWIIKNIHGEFHICSPDIFKATYELVE